MGLADGMAWEKEFEGEFKSEDLNYKFELPIRSFYVALFNDHIDCYEKYSANLGLEDAKRLLKSLRERYPLEDYVILAVLDF